MFAIRAGVILSENYSDKDFTALWREMSKELTLMFKKMRKSGLKFRYVLVAEKHKDGFPHAHMLIHEVDSPITKRTLESFWNWGFTKFLLAESRHPSYLTKYLTKSAIARVRASLHYGTL